MIKATGQSAKGRQTMMIGITHENLQALRDNPGSYSVIEGEQMGLSVDVLLYVGVNDDDCMKVIEHLLTPVTKFGTVIEPDGRDTPAPPPEAVSAD